MSEASVHARRELPEASVEAELFVSEFLDTALEGMTEELAVH